MRSAPFRRAAACAAAALTAAAVISCTDQPRPTEPPAPAGTPGAPGTPTPIVEVDCTGSLPAKTVQCGPQAAATGGSPNVILGGQGVYVQLTSSNVAYNSGSGQFTFDVTLKNLVPQPLGTTDGSTPDAGGVRVFFSSGPTGTGGSGSVSVLPDGFGTFMAPGQAYYQYSQVLAQSQTSAPRTWTLIMPPTVTTFTFKVYVSAPVQYPNGYVALDGHLPGFSYGSLHPASTHALTASVQNAVGDVVPGAVVTWGTTDGACAAVDGSGVVTGVGFATCSVTATSGARSGSMAFDVSGASRTWNGSVSTAWTDAANWDALAPGVPSQAPAAADSVVVPGGAPNYPTLAGATSIGGITVSSGGSIDVASADLTASANVAATGTGAITGSTGRLVLAGTAKTVEGSVGALRVTGTYSLSSDVVARAPVQVAAGQIRSVGFRLRQLP